MQRWGETERQRERESGEWGQQSSKSDFEQISSCRAYLEHLPACHAMPHNAMPRKKIVEISLPKNKKK